MMQELSMNILDIAENSVRAGANLVRITVDEQPSQDMLTITIADDGCGMTPEQVERVSDPFFTTPNHPRSRSWNTVLPHGGRADRRKLKYLQHVRSRHNRQGHFCAVKH